jgi:hypothetical protein
MLYSEQIETAHKIIEHYTSDAKYVLLFALMQSGKTGIFLLVATEMLRLGLVDRVVIFTGNADKDLKKQMKNHNMTEFFKDYRKYLRDDLDFNADDAETITETISSMFVIGCSRELSKIACGENDLNIWDESHFAQSKGQLPDKFLTQHRISVNGENTSNGSKFLSVSATPFSEIVDNNSLQQGKSIVKHEPGPEYYGIKNMMDDGAIKQYTRINIEQYLEELKTGGERDKGILRTHSKKDHDMIIELCRIKEIEVYQYYQSATEDINDIMKREGPLCILVKNKLGMGKRLEHKTRLKWVMQTGKCRLDTVLQGLLGRCCGFRSGGSCEDISIYLPQSMIKMIKDSGYAEFYNESKKLLAPAMNVKKQQYRRGTLYPTIPDKVNIPLRELECADDDIKHLIRDYVRSNRYESKNVSSHLEMMKNDIENPNNITISDLKCRTYREHEKVLEKHYERGEILHHPGTGCGWQTLTDKAIRVFYKQDRALSGEFWTVFIQFRTDVPTCQKYIEVTTKKEVFCHTLETGDKIQQNGVCPLSMKVETATDVIAMQNSIEEAIRFSSSVTNLAPFCRITSSASSNSTWNGIIVNQVVYDALKPGGSIYAHILENCGKSLVCKKSRGRHPKDLPSQYVAKFASIEW